MRPSSHCRTRLRPAFFSVCSGFFASLVEKAQALCAQTKDVVLQQSAVFSSLQEDPRLLPLVETACQCHVMETIHDKCIEGARGERVREDRDWAKILETARDTGVDSLALGVREEFVCDLSDCQAAL